MPRTPQMPSLVRRIWKWSAALLAGLLILLAAGVGLFRVAVPLVPEWRADAEAMAEQALGWPVHIGQIDLRWSWPGPELVLTDVQLLAPDTRAPVITAAQLDIAFGPIDLFQRNLRPSEIRLHQPTLALERDDEGKLVLSGHALPASTDTQMNWRQLLDMTLQHGRFTIIDGELHYRELGRNIPGWTLLLQEVSLSSDGRRHELEGSVLPPGALGEQLTFRFDATGPASQPEDWRWSLALGARELRLAWWYQQFPWLADGQLQGALDLAASLQGSGLDRWTGSGRLVVEDLGLVARQPVMDSGSAHFERIAFNWQAEKHDSRFSLDVRELETIRAGTWRTEGRMSFRRQPVTLPMQFSANQLSLPELRVFAQFLPAEAENPWSELRESVLRLSPQGELTDLVIDFDPAATPLAFRVQTDFAGFGFSHWKGIPGVHGLSGRVEGDDRNGRLTLVSRGVDIDTGGMFRTALQIEELGGALRWERREEGWRIRGDDLRVTNPEAQAEAQLVLDLPFEGPAEIDLAARASNVDFHARSTWLPVGIMAEPLVDWLDRAVVAGGAPEATLVLRGPLQNFPFRDDSGVFDLRFRMQDAVVEYADDWPRIEHLNADVHFHNESLDIHVGQATVLDRLQVRSGRASFADLGEALLQVSATVDGDIADGWRFLRQTPLQAPLAGLLDALSVQGPMQVAMTLQAPLKHLDATQVDLDARLGGVEARLHALPWPVEQLHGQVRISENNVRASGLRGRFHANPVELDIVPEAGALRAGAGGDRRFATTRIDMRGRSDVNNFEAYLPASWLARLQGSFDWSAGVRIPGGGEPITIGLASALEGLESALPAPLAVSRKVEARLEVPDAERVDAKILVHDLGVAHMRFVDRPEGWDFDRGHVQLGVREAGPLPAKAGLIIDGKVDRLDLAEWLSLEDSTEGGAAPLLREFNLEAARLDFAGVSVAGQSLRGSRRAGRWELELDGPARGQVSVPVSWATSPQQEPVDVRLQQLHLPAPPEDEPDAKVETIAPDPRELPALLIDIQDLEFGAIRLGHVTGTLERTPIGYATSDLLARAPGFEITLTGRWEYVADAHYTSINGTVLSTDLAEMLSRLGYSPAISAKEAAANVALAWQGSPLDMNWAQLDGKVGVDIRNGSLREVSPGAGRLLGLLSITALPRRLILDFSDFLGEGLHFDELTGDFLITGGNAYTTNVQLRGPALSAVLVGRTGLVERDYDQLAIINPGVSASIPVAGYLAAGPQVGAALLLLSQLLKAPLADITQVKYRITGGWDEPVIERVERNVQNSDADQN